MRRADLKRDTNYYTILQPMSRTINGVNITKNNMVSHLHFTSDSGKIVYRDKVDTIIGIKHPGIILGSDIYGTTWIIHNHFQIGYPQIETWDQFADGAKVFLDQRPVKYNREEIVGRALQSWKRKEQYSWLQHNCQHFVNRIANNKHLSETLDRIANNLIGSGLTAGVAGSASRRRVLANAGFIAAGIGGLIKLFNR